MKTLSPTPSTTLKTGLNRLSLALLLALTLWLGLSGLAYAQGPVLQSTNPVSNTNTAPLTTTVSITYNQDMDASTVSTQTFAVHARQTGLLTETYSVTNGTISLTPNTPFKPGELVQVSATTATLNITGTGPLSPTVWQFRTKVEAGSGLFIETQALGSSRSRGVAMGDVDGDGDLDAFVSNYGVNKVWVNDGGGVFSDSGQSLGSSWSVGVALGDVDGDGDPDAFVSNNVR